MAQANNKEKENKSNFFEKNTSAKECKEIHSFEFNAAFYN